MHKCAHTHIMTIKGLLIIILEKILLKKKSWRYNKQQLKVPRCHEHITAGWCTHSIRTLCLAFLYICPVNFKCSSTPKTSSRGCQTWHLRRRGLTISSRRRFVYHQSNSIRGLIQSKAQWESWRGGICHADFSLHPAVTFGHKIQLDRVLQIPPSAPSACTQNAHTHSWETTRFTRC